MPQSSSGDSDPEEGPSHRSPKKRSKGHGHGTTPKDKKKKKDKDDLDINHTVDRMMKMDAKHEEKVCSITSWPFQLLLNFPTALSQSTY